MSIILNEFDKLFTSDYLHCLFVINIGYERLIEILVQLERSKQNIF